jgi:hypothetical protein
MKKFEEMEKNILQLKKDIIAAEKEIRFKETILNTIEEQLYNEELKFLHISRIYRIASLQFPRLRGENSNDLSPEDVKELEKWIDRAKSADGLKNIVDALTELSKYFPKDIKSNIYGLVQKIIIEGAYKVKKGNSDGRSK